MNRQPGANPPPPLAPATATATGRAQQCGPGRQGRPCLCASLVILLIAGLVPCVCSHPVRAAEIQGQVATLRYQDEALLQHFNRMLYPGKEISLALQKRHLLSVHEEAAAKIDLITERVESVLEMRPPPYHFTLELFATSEQAQTALAARTGLSVDFISFYSRRENTIYLAVANTTLRLVAHEIAHVVTEHYFSPSPPGKIHEIMAQYAAMHLLD